jgi:hypothetical protein
MYVDIQPCAGWAGALDWRMAGVQGGSGIGGIQGLPVIASRRADVLAVLGGGGDVTADRVPVPGDLLGAEPAGDLLLGFGWPHVSLRLVGGGRDPQVIDEPQHVVVSVTQAFQQVPAGMLFAARHLRHLGKAEDDAVPERVLQRRGDLVWHCGQALAAGGVRGVNQPLQGFADLHDGTITYAIYQQI